MSDRPNRPAWPPLGPIRVRAYWERPAWCREDWLRVRVPGGPRYYSPVALVELDEREPGICWVRAVLTSIGEHWGQARYTDYRGEGSVDAVFAARVRAESTERTDAETPISHG